MLETLDCSYICLAFIRLLERHRLRLAKAPELYRAATLGTGFIAYSLSLQAMGKTILKFSGENDY